MDEKLTARVDALEALLLVLLRQEAPHDAKVESLSPAALVEFDRLRAAAQQAIADSWGEGEAG